MFHLCFVTNRRDNGGFQVSFPRLFFSSIFILLAFTHFNFVPFLRLHNGQGEGGRSTGADRWKVGKQAGGGRNRARVGRACRDRASGQAGRRGRWRRHLTGQVKWGAAPGCELPGGTLQNKNLN